MSTGGTQRTQRARRVPTRPDGYEQLRQRMIHETELGLTFGLRFPEQVPPIPTIQVGSGSFDPRLAEEYWVERLDLETKGRRRGGWWRRLI